MVLITMIENSLFDTMLFYFFLSPKQQLKLFSYNIIKYIDFDSCDI